MSGGEQWGSVAVALQVLVAASPRTLEPEWHKQRRWEPG